MEKYMLIFRRNPATDIAELLRNAYKFQLNSIYLNALNQIQDRLPIDKYFFIREFDEDIFLVKTT